MFNIERNKTDFMNDYAIYDLKKKLVYTCGKVQLTKTKEKIYF